MPRTAAALAIETQGGQLKGFFLGGKQILALATIESWWGTQEAARAITEKEHLTRRGRQFELGQVSKLGPA